MHQIRNRPKYQSSDEEEQETNDNVQSSTSSVNPKERSVSAVHSDEKEIEQKISDFSMFKINGILCGKDGNKGIVEQCDALQRLGAALSVYSRMDNDDDDSELEDPVFSQFVGGQYRAQFLEDFNHFMQKHQGSSDQIKKEMIQLFGLKKCTATGCKLTSRHFRRRRPEKSTNIRSSFYRQKFESLHFNIFHLEESGYRYRGRTKSAVIGNNVNAVGSKEDDEKAVNRDLQEAVAAITDCKSQCDFGRFQSDEPNKFTLSVSGIDGLWITSVHVHHCAITSSLLWDISQNMDGAHDRVRPSKGCSSECHRASSELAP